MRGIFLVVSAFFAILTAFAEDKIITINNDTILCRIISISNEAIRYEQTNDGNMIVGKIIPLSSVAAYHRTARNVNAFTAVENPWLFSLYLGGGYMPWLLESLNEADENSNFEKIKKGIQFSVSSHYLINRFMGLGMNYSFFTSGLNGNYLNELDPTYPTYAYSYQHERHYINYIGASVLFQQSLGKLRKLFLTETVSGGLLLYRGESSSIINLPVSSGFTSLTQNSLIEGNTLGAMLGLSAGYRILPHFTIGAGVDFLYGKLKKVDLEYKNSQQDVQEDSDFEIANPLSISRFNYSIVLRYTL